jgi:hypothetical protein
MGTDYAFGVIRHAPGDEPLASHFGAQIPKSLAKIILSSPT